METDSEIEFNIQTNYNNGREGETGCDNVRSSPTPMLE